MPNVKLQMWSVVSSKGWSEASPDAERAPAVMLSEERATLAPALTITITITMDGFAVERDIPPCRAGFGRRRSHLGVLTSLA